MVNKIKDPILNKTMEDIGQDNMLRWHLQYNFYPAKSLDWLIPAKMALYYVEQGKKEENLMIHITPFHATAGQIIEYLRLNDMVQIDEEFPDYSDIEEDENDM